VLFSILRFNSKTDLAAYSRSRLLSLDYFSLSDINDCEAWHELKEVLNIMWEELVTYFYVVNKYNIRVCNAKLREDCAHLTAEVVV
jgi:hypothetical protein